MKRSLGWYRRVLKEKGHEYGPGFCIAYGGNRERSGIRILEDPLFAICIDEKMQAIVRTILHSPKRKNYPTNIKEETGHSNPGTSVRLFYLYHAGVLDWNVIPNEHHSLGTIDTEWFSVSPRYRKKLEALLMKKQC